MLNNITQILSKSFFKTLSKTQKILIISLILITLLLSGATFYILNIQKEPLPVITQDYCSTEPKLNLNNTDNPYLTKINYYQNICNSKAFDKMMIFTFMPQSDEARTAEIKNLGEKLITFEQNGLKPIIVIEPNSEEGLLNFYDFENGLFDSSLRKFLKGILDYGVNESMMGRIIPFPEPNIPAWNRNGSTPASFGTNFNKTIQIIREFYPNIKGTILLNTKSYATDDLRWANGKLVSLKPYLTNIDPGLVESIGLQGFPWQSPSNQVLFEEKDAKVFLPIKLIEEMSEITNNKSLLLNTGSFATRYSNNPDQTINIPPFKRRQVLDSILYESKELQSKGYSVNINIFSENKTKTEENVDWSYSTPDQQAILKEFIARANVLNIELSVFDK